MYWHVHEIMYVGMPADIISPSRSPHTHTPSNLLSCFLKGATVSPCVCYSILNVLYAYAYIVRLYNGDHLELAVQASQVCVGGCGRCGCVVGVCRVWLQQSYRKNGHNAHMRSHNLTLDM